MIIQRLKLKNWKNLRDVEIQLTERAFIVGVNAAGKSNLLDAVRFFRDLADDAGGLQQALNKRGGFLDVRNFYAPDNESVGLTVFLGSPEQNAPADWVYELEIAGVNGNFTRAEVVRERVWSGEAQSWILDWIKTPNGEIALKSRLEQPVANAPFRPMADFFQQIDFKNPNPVLSKASEVLGLKYPVPSHLGVEARLDLEDLTDSEKEAFLNLVNQVIGTWTGESRPFVKGEFDQFAWITPSHHPMEIDRTTRMLSDGTLRLISLLRSLIKSSCVLLIEEPETHLNPSVLKGLAELLYAYSLQTGRHNQLIVTTHSYDLLDNQSIGPEEVVLLVNKTEGVTAWKGSDIPQVVSLLEAGSTMAEAIFPFSQPGVKFTQQV